MIFNTKHHKKRYTLCIRENSVTFKLENNYKITEFQNGQVEFKARSVMTNIENLKKPKKNQKNPQKTEKKYYFLKQK